MTDLMFHDVALAGVVRESFVIISLCKADGPGRIYAQRPTVFRGILRRTIFFVERNFLCKADGPGRIYAQRPIVFCGILRRTIFIVERAFQSGIVRRTVIVRRTIPDWNAWLGT